MLRAPLSRPVKKKEDVPVAKWLYQLPYARCTRYSVKAKSKQIMSLSSNSSVLLQAKLFFLHISILSSHSLTFFCSFYFALLCALLSMSGLCVLMRVYGRSLFSQAHHNMKLLLLLPFVFGAYHLNRNMGSTPTATGTFFMLVHRVLSGSGQTASQAAPANDKGSGRLPLSLHHSLNYLNFFSRVVRQRQWE